MPLYMDVHNVAGATARDAADAQARDLQTQRKYDVRYLRYWVDERRGKISCLVDAPDAEAVSAVHREARGLICDQIYQVEEVS